MAETKQITILDFVEWVKQQVDLGDLSALMTHYGYADDSVETIAIALDDTEFQSEFFTLLKASLEADKSYHEQQRAAGELSLQDWLEIAKSESFVGVSLTNGFNWNDLLIIARESLNVLTNPAEIPETPAQKAERLQKEADAKKSSTFMWIIVAVVVISVIAILLLATKKK
jgi:hypothetical protein